ncbi:2-polyprenyl-6-methoxyphenol hydroxylase-like FAD-dependent oxidoreductase [Kribbella rubisoli]|uniref:2-polyprenyl-6-methoxyphenol hydroxylase-like FAD-dependent oxidoreductase n=1 Tax=Kribbella rubisoli TaxID=3075929 RepID=A0A4V2FX66_9ACTN|nr:FAD-dependent monooxygenase [Kribbella rubisoli]RZU12476.1 2-polyprenyl-6-methoxyphenol hydroxylase-like FAD-dependent oxidoreductase [Kribbella rubisoli]
MKVAIMGAGIGGLALAQGLLKAGVDVKVFERDPSPRHRNQGYRIHISPVGEEALAAVLPDAVRRRVIATATRPGDLVAGFDAQLNVQFEQEFPVAGPDAVTSVDRYAFRRALMTGLDDVLEFGKQFESYVETPDGVEISFADGTSAVADVLVGADGVGSRVRGHLLPEHEVVDIGVRCIYGKVPLTKAVRSIAPPAFLRGFCFASDGAGTGVAFGPVVFREPPTEYGDYLMAVLTGTNEVLGASDDELFTMSRADLWDIVTRSVASWHPAIRSLIDAGQVDAAFPITLRTCIEVPSWSSERVTLLGDAVHPMTPAAGAGANTALWDAARLTKALTSGEDLASYQQDVITNGQAVVTESLHNAERLFRVSIPV